MFLEIVFTRFWVRLVMIFAAVLAAIFGLLGPFFQKEFVDQLTGNPLSISTFLPTFSHLIPHSPAYFLIFAFFSILLNLVFMQMVNFLGATEAIHLQRVWSQRMYDQILELRADSLGGRPIGELVAIYTTDLPGATILLEQSLPQACSIIFPLLITPFLIVALFHTPILSTLMIMAGIILMNLILANRQSKFFYQFKKLAADRIGLVNEWIQNIRTLRILGWTRHFEQGIFQVREVETENRVAMLNNGQTMNAIASSITFVLNVTVLLSMLESTHSQITPGALLALLWVVAVFLTRPFRQMPWFFTFLFDGTSSLRRAANLFTLKNIEPFPRSKNFQKLKDLGSPDPAISIKNLNLKISATEILKNISFTVGMGEFIAIVGEVGSGKSLLLLSLLAETGAEFGQYKIGENDVRQIPLDQLRQFFTFVPQEGFIMSASLRENVTFEYDYKSSSDNEVMKALAHSQFNYEQERVKNGLDTEIGERGVNLSGGQRQRVSLARVDFYRAPIVLLDDCLSAVDVDTERKIVDSLLLNEWRERTRILATHRLTVLEKVDRVLFLKDGELVAQGKYTDLLRSNEDFRIYTSSVNQALMSTDMSTPITTPPVVDFPAGEK